MNKKPTGIVVFGTFFLAVGLLWLGSICQCSLRYQTSPLTAKKSYAQLYRSAAGQSQRLSRAIATARRQPLAVDRFMPKAYIIHFWMIACWELVLSLLYILSGAGLLRRYRFACALVLSTLLGDLFLKILVVSHHLYILQPLKPLFNAADIMFVYFQPDAAFASQIRVYLTGLKFIQPGFLAYTLVYGFYVLGVWYYFTRPAIKARFSND